MDALVRDVRARQSMVRAVLEVEDEAEPLPFVGSHRLGDGKAVILGSLRALIGVDLSDVSCPTQPIRCFRPVTQSRRGFGSVRHAKR